MSNREIVFKKRGLRFLAFCSVQKGGAPLFPLLETERLILREITQEDVGEVFACFSNEQVIRYYGQEKMKSVAEASAIIDFFAQSFQEVRGIRWGMERKGTKGIIGSIGWNAFVPKHRRAEIGYEVHPDFWRNGYAEEAVSAVLSYGFGQLELNRAGAIVFIENEASSRLLKKHGFLEEGILRRYLQQNGMAKDVIMYSLLKEDYLRQRKE